MGATTEAGTVDAGPQDWAWTIEPPEGWLVVPSAATETPELVSAWEHDVAAAIQASFETGARENGADELSDDDRARVREVAADSVASLRRFADEVAQDGDRVVAAVGVMDRAPVPVLVSVGVNAPDHPDDALMDALGATGGANLSPPNIEYLDLPDGDGVQVTRLELGRSGSAWMSLALGRRTEHPDAVVDTVVLWRTKDLFAVPAMRERLGELLPAVKIIRSET
ncbi:hypothetical protein ACFWEJ_21815 [Promicromonospora sp. NPDC060204]|uniref:hypothetical protein n=1 Tax=Promicromonospora sp. NPDC060204 TaxID=3347071 RepID=UPI003665AC29